ncbi:MAG: hypothetical protein ACQESX_03435 [Bacteroidota bacterium]
MIKIDNGNIGEAVGLSQKIPEKHRAMLQMLLKDSFYITSVETRSATEENRIIPAKILQTEKQD